MGRPSSNDLPLVDSHLELAENATLFGRDLTLRVAEIRSLERTHDEAGYRLPARTRAGWHSGSVRDRDAGFLAEDVGEDFELESAIYCTSEEAEVQALTQIGLYGRWEDQGRVRLLRSVDDWRITCSMAKRLQALGLFCS
jgi:membrane dipeptidase